MRINSPVLDIFAVVMKVMKHTRLWDAKLAWYLPSFSLRLGSTASESTVWGLAVLAWLSRFLQPEQNFFNHPVTLQWSSAPVIFWPSTQPQNTIPRWYTGRKWHIPMASNRKRSRGRIKAYDMGQGEGPIVPLQSCTGRE